MRCLAVLSVLLCSLGAIAQEKQPLETPSSPFDFDNYRRTPLQARQTSTSWASKDNNDLQRSLISGEVGKKDKKEVITTQAAAFFEDPKEVPLRQEPEPLPTKNELTDEITVEHYGETTKGQRDLLARGRVAENLDLTSMSDSDFELYVARRREEIGKAPPVSGEGLLRPMPSLTNTKTGGPPHMYAVSQAGVGARSEPRDGQNPFEDLIQALHLDRPITKGTDSLPAPQARLTVAANAPTPPPNSSPAAATTEPAPTSDQPSP